MFDYLMISGLTSLTIWVLLLLPNFLSGQSWSLQAIGWAVGIFFLFHLVFQTFAGFLADRIGAVRTAVTGVASGLSGGMLYCGALWFPWLIFPARMLHAVGVALIYAGPLIQLMQTVPLRLRGRVIGYYGLPGFVMIGLGPIIAEWLANRWGFRGVFLSVPILFSVLGCFVYRLPRHLPKEQLHAQPFLRTFRVTFDPLRSILIFSTVFGLSFASWNSFLAPAVMALGRGGASSFGSGYALGALLTRMGLSHHLETGSRRKAAVATLLVYGICVAAIPRADSLIQLFALGLLGGMGHGIYYPSLSSIAAERFHPLNTGQAMSLYISSSSLGQFIGPPIWGILADQVGYSTMFAAAGLLLVAGTAAFLIVLRAEEEDSGTMPPREHGANAPGD